MTRPRALGVGGALVVGLGLTCAVAAPAGNLGCTPTNQCDVPPFAGGPPGSTFTTLESGLVVWESSPLAGPWATFPHQQTYDYALPPNFVPSQPPVAWVSTQPDVGDPASGATLVLTTGQLALISPYDTITPDGGPPFTDFNIQNGTCADYFLYVSVVGTFTPPPVSDDAGAD